MQMWNANIGLYQGFQNKDSSEMLVKYISIVFNTAWYFNNLLHIHNDIWDDNDLQI